MNIRSKPRRIEKYTLFLEAEFIEDIKMKFSFNSLLYIVKKDDLFRTTNLFETPRWYPSKAHSSDQGCQITFQLIGLSEMTYLGICSPAYTEWLPVLLDII